MEHGTLIVTNHLKPQSCNRKFRTMFSSESWDILDVGVLDQKNWKKFEHNFITNIFSENFQKAVRTIPRFTFPHT